MPEIIFQGSIGRIRLDKSSSFSALRYLTAADGNGFGLHVVENVADIHGWDIRVTDGANGGARFEITGVEFVDPWKS